MSDLINFPNDSLIRNHPVSPAVFGISVPEGKKVRNYNGFSPENIFSRFVPKADPEYFFDPDIRQSVLLFLLFPYDSSLFVAGPTGCGKSSVILQTAARFNWPLLRITASPDLDPQMLFGGFRLKVADDKTVTAFEYGPLAMAYKFGFIFLLDEYDQLQPSVVNAFNTILEGGDLVIPETGEVIKRHENFRFVATANSNGQGDTTGVYAGVKTLNVANLDRFLMVNAGYMPEEYEVQMLAKKTEVPEIIVNHFVMVANKIRQQFIGSVDGSFSETPLSVTCSTRSLYSWIMRYKLMRPSVKSSLFASFDLCIGNRSQPSEKEALHIIIQSIFGETE